MEERDQDRRIGGKAEGEEETTLESCCLEQRTTWPRPGFVDNFRGLRRGRVGAAVNAAAFCIFSRSENEIKSTRREAKRCVFENERAFSVGDLALESPPKCGWCNKQLVHLKIN